MAAIVRIETAGPGAKARRLCLDDGLEPRLTSAAAVKALSLEVGADVQRDDLETALAEVELPLAKERALLLLGYRERSVSELARKLAETGYPPAVVREVVDRYADVELVDDARFAGSWARTRLGAGYGPRRVARELAEKGVDEAVAQAAIADALDGRSEVELARAALRGRTAHDRAGRERLVRRLCSRGFELRTALTAVDATADALETDEP